MRRFITLLALAMAVLLAAPDAWARSTSVKGYTKKDGTYVAPHQRTTPNRSKNDNWSTTGNVNPYTGKKGTKEP